MNPTVLYQLSYGVYVVASLDGTRPTGCVANSIMQITASPSTIAVSMNHDNFTHECITKSGMFSVSILGEQIDPGIIGRFGFQSGKSINKFDETDFQWKENLPVLNQTCGYLICKVKDKMETETHTVFLADVLDAEKLLEDEIPMTYRYYHQVIKGKSPKNAPTYQETVVEEPKATNLKHYVCQICGYIYEGEFLPPDYVCPICNAGADQFICQEDLEQKKS